MSLAPKKSRLARVLEPEVMDSLADARDYDAMDHAEVNRRFVADFLEARARRGVASAAPVLDLGTATAQIPIELCRQDARARVVAIDLAEQMLRVAMQNVTRAGFADRVALELVDAKRLPYADGCFAAVMSNSIVHHIPEPRHVLLDVVRVTAPGGLIFIRDLARPSDDADLTRLVATYAADCNAHQRQLFGDSLRAALSVEEMRGLATELGFDPLSVQPTSDRHWTWSATR